MLWVIVTAMLAVWMVGLASGILVGGLIHLLLFVALMAVVVRLMTRRQTV